MVQLLPQSTQPKPILPLQAPYTHLPKDSLKINANFNTSFPSRKREKLKAVTFSLFDFLENVEQKRRELLSHPARKDLPEQ